MTTDPVLIAQRALVDLPHIDDPVARAASVTRIVARAARALGVDYRTATDLVLTPIAGGMPPVGAVKSTVPRRVASVRPPRAQVERLRADGRTWETIASLCGCSVSTARRALR